MTTFVPLEEKAVTETIATLQYDFSSITAMSYLAQLEAKSICTEDLRESMRTQEVARRLSKKWSTCVSNVKRRLDSTVGSREDISHARIGTVTNSVDGDTEAVSPVGAVTALEAPFGRNTGSEWTSH